MGETQAPEVYSIAAHRGFADALVAGLVPRYSEDGFGLARLTLLVPSSRAARTLSEAFIRHSGAAGLLMPRMVTVGDLDLDEALGNLLDPLGASDIPPAVEPTQRWLELANLIEEENAAEGLVALPGAARLRLARDIAQAMDRLLVEDVAPQELLGEPVLQMLDNLSEHWRKSLRLFARVERRWRQRLEELGRVDAATRRNMLFERAAKKWRDNSPAHPIVAAGVTSASPALARMLRAIANLPNGAVILPDLDLSMSGEAWDELGRAGASSEPGGEVFGKKDALTHPQYHLKLLLQRMGINRAEVRQWHRKGDSAAPPARSHAISSLFLPPQASQSWISMEADKRRLSGVRLMTTATSEEEAQAIAMLVRQKLDEPEKRIAVVTADRSLARRVTQHLERWNIIADDTAGKPLSLTPAGRLFGLLAALASDGLEPAALIAALGHPLVQREDEDARRAWLNALRKFEYKLRGPSPAPSFEPLRTIADKADVREWWDGVEAILTPLLVSAEEIGLADALDILTTAAEALAGEAVWAREDGRALSAMVEDVRLHARVQGTAIAPADIAGVLRDCMDAVSVRPPYGGHPRVNIYGLLESRMARADLIICGGLNEGSWPQPPGADPLLAPGVLRTLGVPGAEFRIGLSAHDLAGALGAPEVVLSRAQRDTDGPTLASRFWLRAEALLGETLAEQHREETIPALMPLLDRDPVMEVESYPRPKPKPSEQQRQVKISATALDRLLGDPYQFYAREILGLKSLDPLAADPFGDPALRGTLVHDILEAWHKARVTDPDLALVPFAEQQLTEKQVHPLFWGLWRPRICAALERFEEWVDEAAKEGREIIATEVWGEMMFEGVRVMGKPDRIDRLPDGTLAIVDYKTGSPPSASQVEAGYALQLGLLGMIADHGAFKTNNGPLSGDATGFEYWSLAKKAGEFGFVDVPMKVGRKRSGLLPEDFLHEHERYLREAISKYIKGAAPFTAKENPDYPGYTDYDQLMRLEEWQIGLVSDNGEDDA
ncbi:double-strand break repair protein AddB [Erythrobacter sp. F6033]|uniref:double-strand break repair protein AddB n=1 Tax=Erythrobacter sp. F6033 TaxID=2926401 RepID=UPI001FF426B0|nr:double-strand break repair protein AddB [Erythrobacter sp. F6033]